MTAGLDELGLDVGQPVRFRRREDRRWKPAVVTRRERDGSVGLRDADGRARAIPVGCIEVPVTGRRGGAGWEPLALRLGRDQQLRLGLDEATPRR